MHTEKRFYICPPSRTPLKLHPETDVIISHRHKFIFLKPRKVAGTSFEIALSKFMGPVDTVTKISPRDEKLRKRAGYCKAQNFHKRPWQVLSECRFADLRKICKLRWPEKYYNHMSAQDVRQYLGDDLWNDYLKLSIVRNPWEGWRSLFYYANRKNPNASFREWSAQNLALIGQNNAQYRIDGNPVIDHFIQFEDFQTGVRALEQQKPGLAGLYEIFTTCNAKSEFRKKSNRSLAETYADLPEVDALIRQHCATEIAAYNYSLS